MAFKKRSYVFVFGTKDNPIETWTASAVSQLPAQAAALGLLDGSGGETEFLPHVRRGTWGNTSVNDGGTLSPGNSPGTTNVSGTLTFADGGNLNWQLFDASLAAGTGYDLISVSGTPGQLNITATLANPFNINLWTLSSITPDTNGNALNFDNSIASTCTLVTTTGGVTGFSSDTFQIFTTANNGTGGFQNGLGGGSFSVSVSGNDLLLNFSPATPIPEPSSLFLLGFATFGLLVQGYRRRKRDLSMTMG